VLRPTTICYVLERSARLTPSKNRHCSLATMISVASTPQCGQAPHDPMTFALSACISIGLVASYLPQHYRIISSGSSEGFSPWFLLLGTFSVCLKTKRPEGPDSNVGDLLGATSSASSLLNVIALQWGILRCCSVWVRLSLL
jgi:hypothetical protein